MPMVKAAGGEGTTPPSLGIFIEQPKDIVCQGRVRTEAGAKGERPPENGMCVYQGTRRRNVRHKVETRKLRSVTPDLSVFRKYVAADVSRRKPRKQNELANHNIIGESAGGVADQQVSTADLAFVPRLMEITIARELIPCSGLDLMLQIRLTPVSRSGPVPAKLPGRSARRICIK
jgi:hypothetical protein